MASGLFSEQYLPKGETVKQRLMKCPQKEITEDKEGVINRVVHAGQHELAAVPGGFSQGFQSSDTQLCTDGIVQFGRVWVW